MGQIVNIRNGQSAGNQWIIYVILVDSSETTRKAPLIL